METAAINVNIPTSLNDRLEAQARARLTSKSALVREALLRHVQATEPEPTIQYARRARGGLATKGAKSAKGEGRP